MPHRSAKTLAFVESGRFLSIKASPAGIPRFLIFGHFVNLAAVELFSLVRFRLAFGGGGQIFCYISRSRDILQFRHRSVNIHAFQGSGPLALSIGAAILSES